MSNRVSIKQLFQDGRGDTSLQSQKSLRFLTNHHHRHHHHHHHRNHRSNVSPPHTHHHTHLVFITHIHVTDPRSPTSLIHSRNTVTPHVHDHSYASLPHPPSKQTDAITKVNNWMNVGSVCSNPWSSAEAVTAATSPAPATYAEAAAASPTQPPAFAIA